MIFRSFFLLALGLAIFSYPGYAQQDAEVIIDNDQLIYESPSLEKLSQLFVALNRVDLDNDLVIREFLQINECDIVKDYLYNEFEWQKIQDATRAHLKKYKNRFGTRFEVLQRLNLGEYDFERQGFNIVDEFAVRSMRLFEILTYDEAKAICGKTYFTHFKRAIVAELSRPMDFDFLPMKNEEAQIFLARKSESNPLNEDYRITMDDVYETRDVYIGLQIKFFASQGEVRVMEGGRRPKFLAVLEGYKVYTDPDKTEVLYEKTFRSQKGSRQISKTLSEQIEELKKQRAEWAEEKKKEEDALKEVLEGTTSE